MMNDSVIRVENVSKKYCRGLKHTMMYGIHDIAKNVIGQSSHSEKLRNGEFWAVNDVSFEVRRGETLGLIGANGSGKSTILKMLNGIFMPDKGRIEINGRVGALIEVGAGFHPMLTGRENVYINGSILGMTKKEIDRKFEEIVDFADIGDFIDSPVKHYSSGMYVRLGFAVAVHCEPDILLIDEVLAVGDEEFRRKCMSKLNEFKSAEKAIVLVSHSMELIQGYCNRAMWVDAGVIKDTGVPRDVINRYFRNAVGIMQNSEVKGRRWGSGDAEITDIRLFNHEGKEVEIIESGEEALFVVRVRFKKNAENPIFGILLRNSHGAWVYGTNTMWHDMKFATFHAGEEITVTFRQRMNLVGDVYYIDPSIAYPDGITSYDWRENALKFSVVTSKRVVGVSNLDSCISVQRKADGQP
ncbi:MAG: ABC transporter ATP-binding protein [Ignavibacteriae bacterium]|nr:ABC transporter ATP-binding protein [Ignavibacteriota bacterium]